MYERPDAWYKEKENKMAAVVQISITWLIVDEEDTVDEIESNPSRWPCWHGKTLRDMRSLVAHDATFAEQFFALPRTVNFQTTISINKTRPLASDDFWAVVLVEVIVRKFTVVNIAKKCFANVAFSAITALSARSVLPCQHVHLVGLYTISSTNRPHCP